MKKLDMIMNIKKMLEAVQNLPDEFSVEGAEAYYDGRIRVRVDAADEDALYHYAHKDGLYCKTVNGEYESYDGVHVLDENGTELYMMVHYRGTDDA